MPEKWTNIGSIPSETSRGTTYGIDANADGTLLRCRCMSYIHSTAFPKTCKHVEDPRAGVMLRDYQEKIRPKTMAGAVPCVPGGASLWYDGQRKLQRRTHVVLQDTLDYVNEVVKISKRFIEHGGCIMSWGDREALRSMLEQIAKSVSPR